MLVVLLGLAMAGMHGFSFFTGSKPGTPAAPGTSQSGLLEATMPDGTVIAWHSTVNETWAGVAQSRNGKWTVLAAGTVKETVSGAAEKSWAADKSKYRAKWIIVPVRKMK